MTNVAHKLLTVIILLAVLGSAIAYNELNADSNYEELGYENCPLDVGVCLKDVYLSSVGMNVFVLNLNADEHKKNMDLYLKFKASDLLNTIEKKSETKGVIVLYVSHVAKAFDDYVIFAVKDNETSKISTYSSQSEDVLNIEVDKLVSGICKVMQACESN